MTQAPLQSRTRLNVLLTEDRPHAPEHWTEQLPRLLEPQGVAAYVARSAQEALVLAGRLRFHAAIIDMATPMGDGGAGASSRSSGPGSGPEAAGAGTGGPARMSAGPAGLWLLELFRRLPNRPPIVVVHGPAISDRELNRFLSDALRLGAFSVLHKPVQLEQLLSVFRRLLDSQYQGIWPQPGDGNGSSADRPGNRGGPAPRGAGGGGGVGDMRKGKDNRLN
jgi:CheY-like chemotaxis protein